jgi:membrane protease YdiL (CAAX protease family)
MQNKLQVYFALAMVVLASPLGIMFWRTLANQEPQWWSLVTSIALVFLLILTLLVPKLKSLFRFATIIVIIFLVGYGGGWDWGLVPFIRSTQTWISWTMTVTPLIYEISFHLLRLIPALIILLFLFVTNRKRKQFFLTKGNIHANVEPTKLLGIKKPESWVKIALIFATVFVIGITLFLLGSINVDLDNFVSNLLTIPVAILIALMNSFNEEFTLRAAPLGELNLNLGKTYSLLVTTLYFGLGHYYGVPSGIIGVILSAFLGWFLGKSILETKGIFIAWLVHFLTDIPIFLFFLAK